MKGLIIREPWISKILSGTKTWEMRSQATKHRGPIGLIRQGTGLVVGVADLVDSLPALAPSAFAAARDRHGIPSAADADVLARGWIFPWVLRSVRALREPVPAGQKSGAVTWVLLSPAAVSVLQKARP